MNCVEIKPIESLNAAIQMPGSKSYTQRALVIASLAEGKSVIENPLLSEDTIRLIEALQSVGSEIRVEKGDILVNGVGGRIRHPRREIYLGNNGTALRFLISLVSLGEGDFLLTGDRRLCERPVRPLLEALKSLGVKYTCRENDGYPPVVIHAAGLRGGLATFHNLESSQYVSSLLIAAPYASGDVQIEISGSIASRPYLDMTLEVMKVFGAALSKETENRMTVKSGQTYTGRNYLVEGDISSASYFFLAAALSGGRVRVHNVNPMSLQGDIRFLEILEKMGSSVATGAGWIEVVGGELKPGEQIFNLGNMPDMVPTLAVLAALRPGRTIIENVAHLRLKESDRLAALATELRRIGIFVDEGKDRLIIEGGKPSGAEIATYNDHRIAMSFTILGLVVPGMTIEDPDCVNKSFPGFWEALGKLY
jgi:3-phosphoshikimate 1-carboxyvinyltransferase